MRQHAMDMARRMMNMAIGKEKLEQDLKQYQDQYGRVQADIGAFEERLEQAKNALQQLSGAIQIVSGYLAAIDQDVATSAQEVQAEPVVESDQVQ